MEEDEVKVTLEETGASDIYEMAGMIERALLGLGYQQVTIDKILNVDGIE